MKQVKDKEIRRILDNVQKIRLEKNVSILELVKRTGISHSNLYYIESKQVTPSLPTLLKLAKGLGVSLKDFLD